MPETFDSVVPERLEPFPEDDAFKIRKLFSNSETLARMEEALYFLPNTREGEMAHAEGIKLIEAAHEAPLNNVDAAIKAVHDYLLMWSINVE